MVLSVVDSDIDVDDISVDQRAIIGNAVANHLVHGRAAALGKLERRILKTTSKYSICAYPRNTIKDYLL